MVGFTGGAIHAEYYSQITSTNSEFLDNRANRGGAIFMEQGCKILLEGSNYFHGNLAQVLEQCPELANSSVFEYPGNDIDFGVLAEGGTSSCTKGYYGSCSEDNIYPGFQAKSCALDSCTACKVCRCIGQI